LLAAFYFCIWQIDWVIYAVTDESS